MASAVAEKREVLGVSALVGNNKEVVDADGQGKGHEMDSTMDLEGGKHWHMCVLFLIKNRA